jgi:hypothetical protein
MPHSENAWRALLGLLLSWCVLALAAQQPPAHKNILLTAVDENGVTIPGAHVTVTEPAVAPLQLWTDYAGQSRFTLQASAPYAVHAEKGGFYQASLLDVDPQLTTLRVVLAHEQFVKEEVSVNASTPGIDTQQVSDDRIMNVPEIVNIPYPTSRDIRNLLPFYPGVVQDSTGQVHVDGSETWQTLDTIDGFDVRSPAQGTLDIRVSADAVRSIDEETTRYPVQYGRATGGVIAFYTGMGDNKFRFNATNFIPSYRDVNGGIHFDKFVPRFTFSGPLVRDHAWWFDGVELEYDNNYIPGLPPGADTNPVIRGSNLAKAQTNVNANNILTAGLLFNDYHAPYQGLSTLVPQQSTTETDIIAWLPYVRDQWTFHHGALLDIGAGEMRYRNGYEPYGDTPYEITPELTQGSYFENLTGRSSRLEGTAELYLPPRHWAGEHNLRLGIDLDHINYNQDQSRAPVSYLNENGTLARTSTFPQTPPFSLHNDETGAYIEDRWRPLNGLLFEPGLRFDWDSLIRRPLLAPRLAAVYAPPHAKYTTKISAGIGLYYDHTQLSYFIQPFAGIRYDTYYTAAGTTPTGPPQESIFTANDAALREPRAVNWSVGVERKLPWNLYGGVNYLQKITSDMFTFVNQSGPAALSGDYALTNARLDHYHQEEFDLRRLFRNGYTLYVAYTHSSARTNAALDYLPTPSPLGPQQPGPQPWDTPNRTISWGWLPFDVPKINWFKKNWDFVYTLTWQTGFPFTAVNPTDLVVGAAGAYRFPAYINFSPGLEWRFHFRGAYYGLRGVIENATDSQNPAIVNNNIASPQFGIFTEPQGRALTARLRLIGSR